MSEWVDLFHVLSEIVLVLIIVRLQYELFCVRRAIGDFLQYVNDLKEMGILISKPSFGTKRGSGSSTVEKAKE